MLNLLQIILQIKIDEAASMDKRNIGTWPSSASASDVEEYLMVTQKKFRKYRLNIFDLNHVSSHILQDLEHILVCARCTTLVFPKTIGKTQRIRNKIKLGNEF